jgi:hypothetical protein
MVRCDLSVVVGYIMFYDLLQDKINGSFFSKIDKAIEVAKMFCDTYKNSEWSEELNFEHELEKFILCR